jgi:nitroreductase
MAVMAPVLSCGNSKVHKKVFVSARAIKIPATECSVAGIYFQRLYYPNILFTRQGVNMELKDAILKRRMVRNFADKPVPPEIIERIVDLTRHAPSAGFTQGQSFIVVTQPELRKAIADTCQEEEYVKGGFDPFISKAPVLLIPCTSELAYHRRYQETDKVNEDGTEIVWPVPYWFMDIGCAVMIALLAALDEGLVTAFVGSKDLDAMRTLLKMPAEITPVGVIAVGYRAVDVPSPSLKRGRKPDQDYVHHETW